MGHRPFLILSDYLTRQGIAVLRYDDRGTAASTGDFNASTTQDFASDVEAGIAYLRTRAEIDAERIGLIGHSEGGLIAPMVAVANPEAVAFIVLMAGPGLTGEEILYMQSGLIASASGATEEAIANSRVEQEALFKVLKEAPDADVAEERLRALIQASIDDMTEEERAAIEASGVDQETMIERQVRPLVSPWFRYFLTCDPLPTLGKVQVPVLAINGEKDLQVPPQENLAAIEAALQAGGNEDVTTVELPGLNHLFQTAQTGAPAEYSQIEETIAPAALELIGAWIGERVGVK
jgi:pimeloyl-ACP methyl ester carboxylesterase